MYVTIFLTSNSASVMFPGQRTENFQASVSWLLNTSYWDFLRENHKTTKSKLKMWMFPAAGKSGISRPWVYANILTSFHMTEVYYNCRSQIIPNCQDIRNEISSFCDIDEGGAPLNKVTYSDTFHPKFKNVQKKLANVIHHEYIKLYKNCKAKILST